MSEGFKCDNCDKVIHENDVVFDRNSVPHCPTCGHALGGAPIEIDNIESKHKKIYTEADLKSKLIKFCDDHPLHRGIQILEYNIDDWLKENK